MPRQSFVTLALREVPGFQQIYASFKKFLENNYGSEGTVNDYIRGLCRIILYFHRLPDQITIEEYIDYYSDLHAKEDLSFSTYKIVRAAVIQYFQFINVPAPPAAVPRWHKPKRIMDILNRSELHAVLTSTGTDYMAKAILSTLVGAGCRKSELMNLKLGDLDFEMGRMHIRSGKGDKDRFVPIDSVLAMVLLRHMATSRPTEYLFESAPGKKLKPNTVEKVLAEALEKAGVKKHITIHSLRHLFASILASYNIPLYKIQAYLGHKRLETTAGYIHRMGFEISGPDIGPLGLIYGKG